MVKPLVILMAALVDSDKFNVPKVLTDQPNGAGLTPTQVVINIVFAAAGSIAVLIVAIGGFQYVIAQGDPQKVAKAKNTIIYAVIGLVVVISGYAIVSFIIQQVMPA